MKLEQKITKQIFADILGTSKRTVESWIKSGKIITVNDESQEIEYIPEEFLKNFDELDFLFNNEWDEFSKITPSRPYKIIELFAGCGGLALGLEKSGLESVLVNEIDKNAADTLKLNRPHWNVVNDDISNISFKEYENNVDLISGGFPCQAFSYACNKLGFDDTRGTLFYEFARAVSEVRPKVFIAENVRGLSSHDNGRTLQTIRSVINELGYELVSEEIIAIMFG